MSLLWPLILLIYLQLLFNFHVNHRRGYHPQHQHNNNVHLNVDEVKKKETEILKFKLRHKITSH